MAGRTPGELSSSPAEAALYGAIWRMCEWRLGHIREDDAEAGEQGAAPEPKRVDEIVLCLKQILKSVNKWNKSGGQRGYLTFIVQYVRRCLRSRFVVAWASCPWVAGPSWPC